MPSTIYPVCAYTIRQSKDLRAWAKKGASASFRESKRWVAMAEHLKNAQEQSAVVPILFAAGESIEGVIYQAFIENLFVSARDQEPEFTEVTISHLMPVTPPRPLSSLRLVSTGKPLASNFIRPYAICHTPGYVRAEA